MVESSNSGTQIIGSSQSRKSDPSDAGEVARATVLFVSNNDSLRAKTHAFLESEGILVFSSADVQLASEMVFCACDVNVLIVDQDSLGARRAIALAGELSSTVPRSPVIVLTRGSDAARGVPDNSSARLEGVKEPASSPDFARCNPADACCSKASRIQNRSHGNGEILAFRLQRLRVPIRCPLAGRKIIETGTP